MAVAGPGAELGVAAAAFVGTNVDNCLVAMAMVAGAPLERARRIAVGQMLGFTLIVAAAAAGAVVLYEFSPAVVGLLGLVPLSIGVHGLLVLRRTKAGNESEHGAEWARRRAVGKGFTAAAVVTIASGGDNLAVYIPLFRAADGVDLAAIAAVFAAGEALVTWLIVRGGHHPRVRGPMTRLGATAVPVLLCCVGLLVMVEAGTFSVL